LGLNKYIILMMPIRFLMT